MADANAMAPAGDGTGVLNTALTDNKAAEASRDATAPAGEAGKTAEATAVADAAKVSLDAAKAAVTAGNATDEQKAAVEADKVATDEKAKDAKGDKAKTGAPEKYEDFKLPEGVTLDEQAVAEFLPVAKELNLTQDQAQKLVDLQTKMVTQAQAAGAKAFTDMSEGWLNSAKADPEIGQGKWDESLGHAKLFISKFGSPKLGEALEASQLGNHPEVIRAFAKAGRELAEETKVLSGSNTAVKKTAEQSLYPSMFPS